MSGLDPRTARRIGEAAGDFAARMQSGVPMARCTSAGVGGPVPFLVAPTDTARLDGLLAALRETGAEVRVLGNGTNLLVEDGGGPWVVVRLGGTGGEVHIEGGRVTAPAGWSLPHLVRRALRDGLRGLEHAEGIPGTVGGAVRGNAGAFGGDMGKVVRRVTALREGTVERVETREAEFGYRSSPVGPGDVILEVEMEMGPDDPEALRAEAAGYRARRLASQPVGVRSAGCVFKNPEGDAAGRLIDSAGLKGTRVGGASVSPVHANFFVNEGGATAADFLDLIDLVAARVSQAHGVDLETEVEIWRSPGAGGGTGGGRP
jgi:UDP-N-acetylmuramate dehydrogenase